MRSLIRSTKKENTNLSNDNRKCIHPLCPQDDLDNVNYNVYKDFFSLMLEDKRIHNIAITGNFGIGKSSILRTFEKKENKKFLYLSILEFGEAIHEFTRQELEYSFLRQLVSLCRKKEVPLSKLYMIPESKNLIFKRILSIMLSLYLCVALVLLFDRQISEFLHMLWGAVSFHGVHLFLYIIFIILTSVFAGTCFYWIIMRTKIKEISASVSNANAEVVATAESSENVMAQYELELIYIFQTLAVNYDAVIFEDMDRLPDDLSITIFTLLREINYIVNERIKKSVFRFIYVLNDGLLSKIQGKKFFDYIIPVVPQLGQQNAVYEMQKLLFYLKIETDFLQIFLKLSEQIPVLFDYRTLNQIKNEYFVFERIEKEKNCLDDEELNSYEKAKLLAFVIYKVLLPVDYFGIRENKSIFFPSMKRSEVNIKIRSNENYKVGLALYEVGLLNVLSMRYVGYSNVEVKNLYYTLLFESGEGVKRTVLQSDNEYICASIFEENINNVEICKKFISDVEDVFFKYLIYYKNDISIIEFFLTLIKEDTCENYTYEEIEIQSHFMEFEIKKCTSVLKYFLKKGYSDFLWLRQILESSSETEKIFYSIEQLDESSIALIVTQLKQILIGNVKLKKYTHIKMALDKLL